MIDSRSRTQVVGSGSVADRARAWVAESGAQLVARRSQADIRVVCLPQRLSAEREDQLCIAFVGTELKLWPAALRRSAADAIVAADEHVRNALPQVPFEGNEVPDFAEFVEQIRDRPRIAIGTSVRFVRRAELWGDTHFARDLSDGLRRLGWRTEVQTHSRLRGSGNTHNDLLLYLRGLRSSPPVATPSAVWLISHPEQVDSGELTNHAAAFAAGDLAAQRFGCDYLPQASDPYRFFEDRSEAELFGATVFVGIGSGRVRQSVRYALDTELPLRLIGPGWTEREHRDLVLARFVSNDHLHRYYSSARVVLNDHWPDMARFGMVSNRVFDVLACGSQVLTDRVPGMDLIFGDLIDIYDSANDVKAVLEATVDESTAARLRRRKFILDGHTFDHRAAVLDARLRSLVTASGN